MVIFDMLFLFLCDTCEVVLQRVPGVRWFVEMVFFTVLSAMFRNIVLRCVFGNVYIVYASKPMMFFAHRLLIQDCMLRTERLDIV